MILCFQVVVLYGVTARRLYRRSCFCVLFRILGPALAVAEARLLRAGYLLILARISVFMRRRRSLARSMETVIAMRMII